MARVLVWRGVRSWRAELAEVDVAEDGLSGSGTQLGVDPLPYRLNYRLETGPGWVTRRLEVRAVGEGWRRALDLRSDGTGGWSCTSEATGFVDLPAPGGDLATVGGALDCDLGRSPLTNTMPIRRHDLHRRPGAVDFVMAWVSVPDLAVHPSRQRYEHVRGDGATATVRYVGAHRGFVGELELDGDGFVLHYPDLAERVSSATASTDR